jgi:two-component system chemotaxis sensor kinase CheA
MLANIPQGILTIVEGQRIHAEYSACLETLLETPEIAGQDVMALLFSDSNLGADSLSQIETVMAACIGEARMNYDFNAHLLVDELEKRMSDGRVKILDLNWSPICDEHDTVQRLMLCVRDVSELRKLAAETHEQKRELEIIGEILAVSQEKFHEFIAGAMRFIDENQRLISENAASDGEVIAQLFRNMHTVKGNARTYGLKYLTHSVHLAEHSYDELRKPSPTLAWEPQQLLRELADVQSVLERYARINEHSLGRKGPGRRGNIERYLMVDKEIIQQTLQQLETVNTRNLHELIGARDAVHRVLRLLGTEPLAEALSGVIDSLPSLAQELGKDVPIVEVEDNGYLVRNQAGSLLKNVFMHLMRNALDHGLETPDARRALGKPAPGRLRLKMTLQQDQLAIALSDDGRGLALGRIRKQALARGLIAADARLSDEQVAQLIFVAGFSTAERVSEVSGRGVGLDAVQSFVSREQGRIEIRFVDQERGQDFRQFETVVFLPAAIAVPVDHPLPAPVSDAAQLQLTGQA